MPWVVEILNDKVEAELNAFPADMRARFTRIVELIETFGLQNVGMPHVRHLREKLWEMRLKGRDGIGRAVERLQNEKGKATSQELDQGS